MGEEATPVISPPAATQETPPETTASSSATTSDSSERRTDTPEPQPSTSREEYIDQVVASTPVSRRMRPPPTKRSRTEIQPTQREVAQKKLMESLQGALDRMTSEPADDLCEFATSIMKRLRAIPDRRTYLMCRNQMEQAMFNAEMGVLQHPPISYAVPVVPPMAEQMPLPPPLQQHGQFPGIIRQALDVAEDNTIARPYIGPPQDIFHL